GLRQVATPQADVGDTQVNVGAAARVAARFRQRLPQQREGQREVVFPQPGQLPQRLGPLRPGGQAGDEPLERRGGGPGLAGERQVRGGGEQPVSGGARLTVRRQRRGQLEQLGRGGGGATGGGAGGSGLQLAGLRRGVPGRRERPVPGAFLRPLGNQGRGRVQFPPAAGR